MEQQRKTVFFDKHLQQGAKIVEFANWKMPLQYTKGIVNEHLTTRKTSGLFDVSHMGRFIFRGKESLPFLQHVLTNNAAALEVGQSQYTFIPNNEGGAIDDAYLYRFRENEYLLVVNAANKEKDYSHFSSLLKNFNNIEMTDHTEKLAMLSLQGPRSEQILNSLIEKGSLPKPIRNHHSIATINNSEITIARTGYTGEPVCFEIFIKTPDAPPIWDLLIEKGASPIGLGARDTLRLEAALPLYGHELGEDLYANQIPIFACNLAKFAVSFSPQKEDFIARTPLTSQFEAFSKIKKGDYSSIKDLPRTIMPVTLTAKGIARPGYPISKNGKEIGYTTSGTMVPYWKNKEYNEHSTRAISLALLDSNICEKDSVEIEIRGKKVSAVIVSRHLKRQPPYTQPVLISDTNE